MAKKEYDWRSGAHLEEHTKKKHSILSKYFRQYLLTRCQIPQQEKFRLVVVDGFSGAGLYSCGSFGSPLIFVDVLIKATNEINIHRSAQGMKPIQVECLLLLNDLNSDVVEHLKENITPHLIRAKDEAANLFIEAEFFGSKFEDLYPQIKSRIQTARCSNVLFNLDQCGYSHVTSIVIRDIASSWKKAEVLLTFMIESLLTYLSPQKGANAVPLEPEVQVKIDRLLDEDNPISKSEWLGEAEKVAYTHLKNCATYVSPFSINNPDGWRYWLMHFSNVYRARQVYNNILHEEDATQAHYGRAGLNMLSYDPRDEVSLYLFDTDSRQAAKESLYEDIPNFVAASGDTLAVEEFYASAYSETPAHSDDIHEMIIENPDLEVITESGGKRRQANTIKASDRIKLKSQQSLFFMFSGTDKE